MPERQVDIDMAMHELAQRMRAAYNKEHVVPVSLLEIAKQEARNQWEIEREIEQEAERQRREAPQIEPPERKPTDPGLER